MTSLVHLEDLVAENCGKTMCGIDLTARKKYIGVSDRARRVTCKECIAERERRILERRESKTTPKIHQHHLASCLCCAKLIAVSAIQGYSEYTPGEPYWLGCEAGHLEWGVEKVEAFFKDLHEKAQDCKDFEARSE